MSGPVTFIAQFTVNDPDKYREYEKGFFPVLKPFGGKFKTFDDNAVFLEGEITPGRTVIIEFESEERLMEWWNSPDYQELAKKRLESCTSHCISIVHAMPERS